MHTSPLWIQALTRRTRYGTAFRVRSGAAMIVAVLPILVGTALLPLSARAQSSTLSPPSNVQTQEALTVLNAIRRRLSLPALSLDPRLCAAASGHCAYLNVNHLLDHQEEPRFANYIAADPAGRAAHFGYTGSCFENIRQGGGTMSDAILEMLNGPYHRAPLLQPGVFAAGISGSARLTTLLFGQSADSGVVVYPADGQRDIPTTWNGAELPDPLRVHPEATAHGACGYPITINAYAADGVLLSDVTATLTTAAGAAVPIYLNTPANDDLLSGGAILIPVQPLLPDTTYQVAFQAKDDSGHTITRTWRFTTLAPVAPVPLPLRTSSLNRR